MVKQVVWSPRARAARDSYIDWIVKHDERAARNITDELDEWVQSVAKHLLGTTVRPGLKTHGYKERSKRIFYEVFDDRVEIVVFRDMRQDWRTLKLPKRRK